MNAEALFLESDEDFNQVSLQETANTIQSTRNLDEGNTTYFT